VWEDKNRVDVPDCHLRWHLLSPSDEKILLPNIKRRQGRENIMMDVFDDMSK